LAILAHVFPLSLLAPAWFCLPTPVGPVAAPSGMCGGCFLIRLCLNPFFFVRPFRTIVLTVTPSLNVVFCGVTVLPKPPSPPSPHVYSILFPACRTAFLPICVVLKGEMPGCSGGKVFRFGTILETSFFWRALLFSAMQTRTRVPSRLNLYFRYTFSFEEKSFLWMKTLFYRCRLVFLNRMLRAPLHTLIA